MSVYEKRSITRDEERRIITSMIVSTEFLSQIRQVYRPELLTLHYARTIADWCIEYYNKYEKSPEHDIRSIFNGKKQMIRDEERIEMIDAFLSSLNETYVEEEDYSINVPYEYDKAVKYFEGVNLDNFIETLKATKVSGDLQKANAHIANYKKITSHSNTGVDIFSDKEAAVNAIRRNAEDWLFQFPGALGKLIRPIKRNDFLAIIGPGKRGKSFWLLECGLYASFNHQNVLFISCEMPKEQMQIRIYQRLTGELEPSDSDYTREEEIRIPYFDHNYDRSGIVNFRKEIKKSISSNRVVKKLESMQIVTKSKRFRLESFPSGSINVRDGIIPLLDNLEHYENFVPDVLVLDYADILAPERHAEKRHQIDETWLALRGLGQQRSIAIITASHSNKATFDRDIRQNDLSEDNRKINHVTLAFALNRNDDDEENGIMRISVLADRFKGFSKTVEAVVLQCLDIGRPYLDSRLNKKEV